MTICCDFLETSIVGSSRFIIKTMLIYESLVNCAISLLFLLLYY